MQFFSVPQRIQKIAAIWLVCSMVAPSVFLVLPKEVSADAVPVILEATLPGSVVPYTFEPNSVGPFSFAPYAYSPFSIGDEADKDRSEKDFWFAFSYDDIAWFAAKMMIRFMTKMIVDWINSGFGGAPTFPTDKTILFALIADNNLRQFLYEIQNLDTLLPFIKDSILQALILEFRTSFRYALSTHPIFLEGGYEEWENDYRLCRSPIAWECFILTTRSGNNPFGARSVASGEFRMRLRQQLQNVIHDLIEGSGMLTLGVCLERDGEGNCTREEKHTPGQIISDQVRSYLRSNLDSLEAADELSEAFTAIFDALINQLIQQGLRFMVGEEGRNITDFL